MGILEANLLEVTENWKQVNLGKLSYNFHHEK